MSKPNLFEFARVNESEYPTRFNDELFPLLPAHQSSAHDFRSVVDSHGTVSFNMNSRKFRTFLDSRSRPLSPHVGECRCRTKRNGSLARLRFTAARRVSCSAHGLRGPFRARAPFSLWSLEHRGNRSTVLWHLLRRAQTFGRTFHALRLFPGRQLEALCPVWGNAKHCRDHCYVEAIFVGEISPASVEQKVVERGLFVLATRL